MDYSSLDFSKLHSAEIYNLAKNLNINLSTPFDRDQLISQLNGLQPDSFTPAFQSLVLFSNAPTVTAPNKYSLDMFDDLDLLTINSFLALYNISTSDNDVNFLNIAILCRVLLYSNLIVDQDVNVVSDPNFFYWYSLELSALKDEAFKRCIRGNSRSELVRKIIMPAKYDVPFPFFSNTMGSVDVKFDLLRNYKPVVSRAKYYINGYYPPDSSGKPIFRPKFDPKFKNMYLSTISPEGLYDMFDDITNAFTERARMNAKRIDKPCSPMQYWQTNSDWVTSQASATNVTPRDIIWDDVKEATQFKPSWVKFIMQSIFFNDRKGLKGKKFLDISAGWGDRLVSAISMEMSYMGYDPNTDLKEGHQRIISELSHKSPGQSYEIRYEPFETAYLPETDYDVVFTSPPFFELEIYTDQSNQSVSRYPEYETWLTNFLFTALLKAWSSLKKGGFLAIHISDTFMYQPTKPMNDFLKCLPKSKYVGVLGVAGQAKKYRPVWVFQKSL